MARCAKDNAIVDMTWQDALRQYGGKGYYPTKSNKWQTKINHEGRQIRIGLFDTKEEAADAIYNFRSKRLKDALGEHGLDPDDSLITASRHLFFSDGREFNLCGEYLGTRNAPKKPESKIERPKNQDMADRLNSEYLKRISADLIDPNVYRSRLPKVGDKLCKRSRIPTLMNHGSNERRNCVVTYVNRDHLWFEVEYSFECNGREIKWKESFKLPTKTPKYI